MNKIIFTLLIISALVGCQTQQSNALKPLIQLEKDTFQLGLVTIGDSVNVHLSVKNQGKEPLYIKNIGYGCGCTKGKIKKNILAASESTSFQFTYKNDNDFENFDNTIIFETNGQEPFKLLKILGRGVARNKE